MHLGRDIARAVSKIDLIKFVFQDAYKQIQAYNLSISNCNVLGTIIGFSEQVHPSPP